LNADAVLVALLAAGRGSRFGGGKLDAPCAGKPVGQWVLEAVAAAGLPAGVVVTGPRAPAFIAGAREWDRLVNPQPADGLGASVATAARMARQRGSEALLVLLADMPLVTPELLHDLCAQTGPAAIDHGNGRPGVPAMFPAALYGMLEQCTGDRGAAAVLAHLADLTLIQAPGDVLSDVDTPGDLRQVEARLLQRSGA